MFINSSSFSSSQSLLSSLSKPLSSQDNENISTPKTSSIANDWLKVSQSSQQNSTVLLNKSRIEQMREEYKTLKKPISAQTKLFFDIPKRRVCGFGNTANILTIQRTREMTFVTNDEIIKVHPMRFLPNSPFVTEDPLSLEEYLNHIEDESTWIGILDDEKKRVQAIAISEQGKHIILQQTVASDVPTCLAMLILDHGKQPNYKTLRINDLANTKQAIEWAKEVQLECLVTEISMENPIELLSKCLSEKGPGMLLLDHPTLDEHVVILDEISTEKKEAVIRDPFHGWMVTIKLDVLTTWIPLNADFVQII